MAAKARRKTRLRDERGDVSRRFFRSRPFCFRWKTTHATEYEQRRGKFFLKPNGVFLVTEKGAQIIESSEYPKLRERAIIATQSGPMLVQNGMFHPAFRAGSVNQLFRNGVGVPSPDVALFAISDAPLNFHEFATLFRDKLHCPNALFLDGTISSLHSTELKRSDFRMDLGPILGVTE